MMPQNMEMPEGMEFRAHPDTLKRQPAEPRKKTDWTWVERALFARPGSWARIATDQPTSTIARNINHGIVKAFNPEMIEASAVQVQKGPALYDIYARARAKPKGTGKPSEQELARHRLAMGERRREWYDRHQLAWLKIVAEGIDEY